MSDNVIFLTGMCSTIWAFMGGTVSGIIYSRKKLRVAYGIFAGLIVGALSSIIPYIIIVLFFNNSDFYYGNTSAAAVSYSALISLPILWTYQATDRFQQIDFQFRGVRSKWIFVVVVAVLVGWNVVVYAGGRASGSSVTDSQVGSTSTLLGICPSVLVVWVILWRFAIIKYSGNVRTSMLAGYFSILVGLWWLLGTILINTVDDSNRCNAYGPNTYLVDCYFVNRDLSGSNLEGANLTDSDFTAANLSDSNLTGANLTRTIFTDANLTSARLEGANMDAADLHTAIGVTDEMLNSIASWHGLLLESRENIVQYLAPVCRGDAVVEAVDYNSDGGFHPVVALSDDGTQHEFTQNLPLEWWPSAGYLAELVACVGTEEEIPAANCGYTSGGTIQRYFYTSMIRIVEAHSGTLLEEIELRGDFPDCPEVKVGSGPQSVYGDHVVVGAAINALRNYVHPEGDMERLTFNR